MQLLSFMLKFFFFPLSKLVHLRAVTKLKLMSEKCHTLSHSIFSMFLLKAEPWRSLGTHSELGIRIKFYSFHCEDYDLPLQRLLKENKRDITMSSPIRFLIVFHQSWFFFLKDSKTCCHIFEKKAYC